MRCPAPMLAAALLLAACAPRESPPKPPATTASILTTVGDSNSTIEGIAAYTGLLYVCDWKDGTIYRVDPAHPVPEAVGGLPVAPGTAVLGVAADAEGNLYFALPDSGLIYRVAATRLGAADFDRTKDATRFATGAAGANALTFNPGSGHLWISGGNTGAIYQVGSEGGPVATVATDVSPMSTDTTMPVRAYTSNGLVFDRQGALYSVNTGTGEITRFAPGADDALGQKSSWVRDPRLLGADGIVADSAGNFWIAVNYRNALMRVGPDGTVTEVASSTPSDGGNALRAPAELKIVGGTAYLANLNIPIGVNGTQTVRGASIAAVRLP